MAKKATVTITLEYNLWQDSYDSMPEDEIHEDIEHLAYEDLADLMRGDKLKYWADVSIA
jgi:hypothetical protein